MLPGTDLHGCAVDLNVCQCGAASNAKRPRGDDAAEEPAAKKPRIATRAEMIQDLLDLWLARIQQRMQATASPVVRFSSKSISEKEGDFDHNMVHFLTTQLCPYLNEMGYTADISSGLYLNVSLV